MCIGILPTTCISGACRRCCQILRNWSYRRLLLTTWVLGTKHGSSAREQVLLNWATSPAPSRLGFDSKSRIFRAPFSLTGQVLFLALPSWFYLCLLFRSVSVIYLAVGLCFYYFRLTQHRDPVCLLPDFNCFHPLYLVLVPPHTFLLSIEHFTHENIRLFVCTNRYLKFFSNLWHLCYLCVFSFWLLLTFSLKRCVFKKIKYFKYSSF